MSISGEAGIGKTRLAAELASRAAGSGAVALAGRCDDGLAVPYQPFADILAQLVDRTPPAALPSMLGPDTAMLARLCPAIATISDKPAHDVAVDAETDRYRLFRAVSGWVAAMATDRPLLLVLDDVHWATQPTLLLLRHVVTTTEDLRLLIVLTYRDTEPDLPGSVMQALADLPRHAPIDRVTLTGLDHEGVVELVQAQAGHDLDERGRGLAHTIHADTRGNPFFVQEVLRHMVETGRIVRTEVGWSTVDRPPDTTSPPPAVMEVVTQRVARLSPACATALRTAAVLGPEFGDAALAAMTGLGPDETLTALEEADRAGLVREAAAGRWVFTHALARQSLYEQLSLTRCQRLHLEAAEVLQRLSGTEQAIAIAGHLRGAGEAAEPQRLAEALTRAGESARAQLAWEEATSYYRDAVDLLRGDDAAATRLASLLTRLGDTLLAADDVEQAVGWLEQALALYASMGDEQGVARVRIRIARSLSFDDWELDLDRAFAHVDAAVAALEPAGPSLSLVFAYTVRAAACWWATRIQQGLDDGERAVAIARELGEDGAMVNAEAVLGTNLFHAGQIKRGVTLMLQGIANARGPRQRWQGTLTTATHCHLLLDPAAGRRAVEAELATGHHDEAPRVQRGLSELRWRFLLMEGRLVEARTTAATMEDDTSSWAFMALAEGRWEEAEAALAEICAASMRHHRLMVFAGAAVARCQAGLVKGRIDDADRILAGVLEMLPAERPTWITLRLAAIAAVVAARRGDPRSARAHLQQCRDILASGENYRGLAGLTAVAEGTLAATPDEADGHFAHAVATFARWHLPWLQADALLSWARRTGRAEQREAAAAIYERIGAGAPWIELARQPDGTA